MTQTDLATLETNAARNVRKLSVSTDVYAGIVSSETMRFLNEHARMMAREIVTPLLGFECPEVVISVEWDQKKRLAHYKPGRDGLGLSWRIAMNVRHMARERGDVLRTLLHEMLHAVQEKDGKPGKNNFHNAEFTGWAERLGIPSNEKGQDLGTTPEGPFDAYCKRHKIEGKEKLIVQADLPKAAPTKMKKWVCSCEEPMVVRCARDLDATCNECGEPFMLETK